MALTSGPLVNSACSEYGNDQTTEKNESEDAEIVHETNSFIPCVIKSTAATATAITVAKVVSGLHCDRVNGIDKTSMAKSGSNVPMEAIDEPVVSQTISDVDRSTPALETGHLSLQSGDRDQDIIALREAVRCRWRLVAGSGCRSTDAHVTGSNDNGRNCQCNVSYEHCHHAGVE
jgi:hypothetical protein